MGLTDPSVNQSLLMCLQCSARKKELKSPAWDSCSPIACFGCESRETVCLSLLRLAIHMLCSSSNFSLVHVSSIRNHAVNQRDVFSGVNPTYRPATHPLLTLGQGWAIDEQARNFIGFFRFHSVQYFAKSRSSLEFR